MSGMYSRHKDGHGDFTLFVCYNTQGFCDRQRHQWNRHRVSALILPTGTLCSPCCFTRVQHHLHGDAHLHLRGVPQAVQRHAHGSDWSRLCRGHPDWTVHQHWFLLVPPGLEGGSGHPGPLWTPVRCGGVGVTSDTKVHTVRGGGGLGRRAGIGVTRVCLSAWSILIDHHLIKISCLETDVHLINA